MELVLPQGNIEFTLENLLDSQGETIDVAPGSGHQVSIPYHGDVPDRGVLARYL